MENKKSSGEKLNFGSEKKKKFYEKMVEYEESMKAARSAAAEFSEVHSLSLSNSVAKKPLKGQTLSSCNSPHMFKPFLSKRDRLFEGNKSADMLKNNTIFKPILNNQDFVAKKNATKKCRYCKEIQEDSYKKSICKCKPENINKDSKLVYDSSDNKIDHTKESKINEDTEKKETGKYVKKHTDHSTDTRHNGENRYERDSLEEDNFSDNSVDFRTVHDNINKIKNDSMNEQQNVDNNINKIKNDSTKEMQNVDNNINKIKNDSTNESFQSKDLFMLQSTSLKITSQDVIVDMAKKNNDDNQKTSDNTMSNLSQSNLEQERQPLSEFALQEVENVPYNEISIEKNSLDQSFLDKLSRNIEVRNKKYDNNTQYNNTENSNDSNLNEDEIHVADRLYCSSCKNFQKEIDSIKQQSEMSLKIFKEKIISTSELITDYHKKCQGLEKQKKIIEEMKNKLELCYRDTATLRIQLEKALQANEPLKKKLARLENEKSLSLIEANNLTSKLHGSKLEIKSLQKQITSSRIVQQSVTKDKEDTEKENEKEKKKVVNQVKIIDKLNMTVKNCKEKSKLDLREIRKLTKQNKLLNEKLEKTKKKTAVVPKIKSRKGKASKLSPSGILSPSPSPPVSPVNQVSKFENRFEEQLLEDLQLSPESSSTDESTNSDSEIDSEIGIKLQNYLSKVLDKKNLSSFNNRNDINTLLSPPLSPIPPSPIPFQHKKSNTKHQPIKKKKISLSSTLPCSVNLSDSNNSDVDNTILKRIASTNSDILNNNDNNKISSSLTTKLVSEDEFEIVVQNDNEEEEEESHLDSLTRQHPFTDEDDAKVIVDVIENLLNDIEVQMDEVLLSPNIAGSSTCLSPVYQYLSPPKNVSSSSGIIRPQDVDFTVDLDGNEISPSHRNRIRKNSSFQPIELKYPTNKQFLTVSCSGQENTPNIDNTFKQTVASPDVSLENKVKSDEVFEIARSTCNNPAFSLDNILSNSVNTLPDITTPSSSKYTLEEKQLCRVKSKSQSDFFDLLQVSSSLFKSTKRKNRKRRYSVGSSPSVERKQKLFSDSIFKSSHSATFTRRPSTVQSSTSLNTNIQASVGQTVNKSGINPNIKNTKMYSPLLIEHRNTNSNVVSSDRTNLQDGFDENDSEVASLNLLLSIPNNIPAVESIPNNPTEVVREESSSVRISRMLKTTVHSSSSRSKVITNRRHTVATPQQPIQPPCRKIVERTRSFSPTVFSPPSPTLSPIPPSPQRSILTPIISPLPTTPLPESVSPLPLSPKIASPPLIRDSAIMHRDNLAVHVPKPRVPQDNFKAVKILSFNQVQSSLTGTSSDNVRTAHVSLEKRNIQSEDLKKHDLHRLNQNSSNQDKVFKKPIENTKILNKDPRDINKVNQTEDSKMHTTDASDLTKDSNNHDTDSELKENKSCSKRNQQMNLLKRISSGKIQNTPKSKKSKSSDCKVKKSAASNTCNDCSTVVTTDATLVSMKSDQINRKDGIENEIKANSSVAKTEQPLIRNKPVEQTLSLNKLQCIRKEAVESNSLRLNTSTVTSLPILTQSCSFEASILNSSECDPDDKVNKPVKCQPAASESSNNTNINPHSSKCTSSENKQKMFLKKDVKESNNGFVLKLFNKLKSRSINQPRLVMSLNMNNIPVDSICQIILQCVKNSNDIPDIYKRLTNEHSFSTPTCSCHNKSVASNVEPSVKTKEITDRLENKEAVPKQGINNVTEDGKKPTNSNINEVRSTCIHCQQKENVFKHRNRSDQELLKESLFKQCHPKALQLKTPVVTSFELAMLAVIQELIRFKRYNDLVSILLEMLKESLLSKKDVITVERISLCRFYASCCRCTNNLEELIALLVTIFQDQPCHISLPLMFITSYSVWPSIVTRTDLLKLSKSNTLDLHRVKLSPLSATLQLIAIVESMFRNESTCRKIMEELLGIQLKSESSHTLYYEQMVFELFELLCNKEMAFAIKTADNDVSFCPFVFPTIMSIAMLCKLLGWCWTYNELIVARIWDKLEAWTKNDDVNDDTVSVLMSLLGRICQLGLSCGYTDFNELSWFLIKFLNMSADDVTVSPSIHLSVMYTLLDIAPRCSHVDVDDILHLRIKAAERRKHIIPQRLKDRLEELIRQKNL